MAEEKPHRPSKRKLKKLRGEGTVSKAPEFTQFSATVGGALGLVLAMQFCWERNQTLLHYCWLGSDNLGLCVREGASLTAWYVGSTLLMATVAAVFIDSAQLGGIVWDPRPLTPRAERVNIASGLSRIGAGLRRSIWNLLTAVLGLAAAGWMVVRIIRYLSEGVQLGMVGGSIEVTRILSMLSPLVGIVGALIGIDIYLRRKSFMQQASMSMQELRDEWKEEEGDPQLRAQRRQMHRALSTAEMIRRVRRSRVLIVERRDGR